MKLQIKSSRYVHVEQLVITDRCKHVVERVMPVDVLEISIITCDSAFRLELTLIWPVCPWYVLRGSRVGDFLLYIPISLRRISTITYPDTQRETHQ
jgi:hypothetical protein